MTISDKYVFIHLQKAGGTHMSKFLINHVGGKHYLGKHSIYDQIESAHLDKFKFGLIRNPFSWYVSNYHYQKQNGGLLVNHLGDTSTFKKYLNKMLIDNNLRLKVLSGGVPAIKGYPNIDIDNYRKLNIGEVTLRYVLFFCKNPIVVLNSSNKDTLWNNIDEATAVDKVIKLENICQDIPAVFSQNNISLSNEAKKDICSGKRTNASKHKKYDEYYKGELELITAIKEKDGYILNRYGYEL